MPSVVQYNPARGAGAAGQSQVPEWQRFLDSLPSGGSRPKGPPATPVSSAQTALRNRQAEAAALGVDADGEAPGGLLTRALEWLDKPRQAVTSGLSSLTGLDLEDPAALVRDEDDGLLEKVGKGAGNFAVDVALDPLTYLSFGTASLGRKGAAELAEASVRKAAGKLPTSKLDEWGARSLAGRASQVAESLGDEAAESLRKAPSTFGGTDEEWVRALGTSELSGRAAEELLKGGPGRLRRWLTDELGEDAGRELFDAMPVEVRGGLSARAPFVRRADGGKALPLTRGGGELAERLGLGGLSELPYKARNAVRASRLGRAVADRLGGADGKLYGEVVEGLTKDPEDLARASYSMLSAARRARTDGRVFSQAMQDETARTLGWVESAVETTADPKAARAARQRWFMDPDGLRTLTVEQVDGMDEVERAGVAAARGAHDFLSASLGRLRAVGLSVGEIDEYVPRVMTSDELAGRATKDASRKGASSGTGTYNPTKGRDRYVTADVVPDADGNPSVSWRWLTPEEANQASGRAVFETDPVAIVGRYGEAARRLATRVKFANDLAEAGVLARSGTDRLASVSAPGVRALVDQAERAGSSWTDALGVRVAAAGSEGDEFERLTDELESAIKDRERLTAAAVHAVSGPGDPTERVGTLVEGVLEMHRRVVDDAGRQVAAGVDGAGEALEAARAAHREAVARSGAALSGQTQVSDVGRAFDDAGLRRVGAGPDAPPLPPELDLAYAPEILGETVEKFYRARKPNSSELASLVDGVYRPYFQLFKTYATVGRGPGYHVRNLVGGMWNNALADVAAADYQSSKRLLLARRKAANEVRDREAGALAERLGISKAEASKRLDPMQLQDAADARLREILDGVEVAPGVPLIAVHDATQAQSIGYGSRIREGLDDAIDGTNSDDVLDWVENGGKRNLFRNRRPADLNRTQRAANRAASNRWVQGNAHVAQMSEDFLRTAAFVAGARRYGLEDGGRSAGLLTKALQFDYDDLSEFERTWLRGFAIPFYTWTRNNVPLQLRALMHEPGKIQKLAHANGAVREMFGDSTEDVVPEWMAERLGWVSTFTTGGNPIVLGVESPATDLNKWFKVGKPGQVAGGIGREFVSALSPVVKLPAELATGTNSFTGARFDDDATAPAWYRALPLAPRRRGPDGTVTAPEAAVHAARSLVPPLGQLDRVLGLSPASKERQATSVVSNFAPVAAVSTLTPGQKVGELRARAGRVSTEVGREATPDALEMVRELLGRGYSPEQVRHLLGIDEGSR